MFLVGNILNEYQNYYSFHWISVTVDNTLNHSPPYLIILLLYLLEIIDVDPFSRFYISRPKAVIILNLFWEFDAHEANGNIIRNLIYGNYWIFRMPFDGSDIFFKRLQTISKKLLTFHRVMIFGGKYNIYLIFSLLICLNFFVSFAMKS